MKLSLKKYSKPQGFTLIELLIVIAILGVLAAVVLVAINPLEQLARTRDASRKTAVGQLGRALQAYYTSHSGTFVIVDNAASPGTWITNLVNAGELKIAPPIVAYTLVGNPGGCVISASNSDVQNLTYCIQLNGTGGNTGTATDGVVYATLESKSENSKCPPATPAEVAFFVYSTADGRGGIVCKAANNAANSPIAGTQVFNSVQ